MCENHKWTHYGNSGELFNKSSFANLPLTCALSTLLVGLCIFAMVSGAGAGWLTEIILYTASVSGDSAKNAGIPLASFTREPAESRRRYRASPNNWKIYHYLLSCIHTIVHTSQHLNTSTFFRINTVRF